VNGFPPTADVREVGPRDGLQPERPVEVDDRIRLVHSLQDAGLRHIEAAAFVSPRAVPAMAGAAEVLAGIERRDDVTYAALVPNLKGAELALAAGVDELTVTISASEGYNRSNVGMSVAESEAVVGQICALVAAAVPVDVVVSCTFGSPYEGDLELAAVVALGARLLDAGCDRVTWADTTGMATPTRVHALVDALEAGGVAGGAGLHLHDTRGTALVNAYAALGRGIARFDTAVGGLGGSPFAPGATGNLATEELVALLDDLDVATGVSVEALIGIAGGLADLVGHAVPGRLAAAGPRTTRSEGP
jgi:hydroxymethylglutaryl-CoA lyase